jgi:F-type H+-transporting ATPase subunit beta
MAEKNIGKITQVISAVLDIKFPQGGLPEINDAIEITTKDGGILTVEVAQHLGDDTVRCIALGPTDGLVRGMDAVATGGPIMVPVGEQTLGRIFNVLGQPIDNKEAPKTEKKNSIFLHPTGGRISLRLRPQWRQSLPLVAATITSPLTKS